MNTDFDMRLIGWNKKGLVTVEKFDLNFIYIYIYNYNYI